MNIELYINEEEIVAGMNLRDDEEPKAATWLFIHAVQQ